MTYLDFSIHAPYTGAKMSPWRWHDYLTHGYQLHVHVFRYPGCMVILESKQIGYKHVYFIEIIGMEV